MVRVLSVREQCPGNSEVNNHRVCAPQLWSSSCHDVAGGVVRLHHVGLCPVSSSARGPEGGNAARDSGPYTRRFNFDTKIFVCECEHMFCRHQCTSTARVAAMHNNRVPYVMALVFVSNVYTLSLSHG